MNLAWLKRVVAALWFGSMAAVGPGLATADPPPLESGDAPQAQQLVQAALTAELNAQNSERALLLTQAIAEDGNYAPARWQAGYVLYDGRWQTVEQIAAIAAGDTARKQYDDIRAKTNDDVPGHLKLAAWCREHKLAAAANAHLQRVLSLDPNHAQAMAQLGFRKFRGGWATEAQITEFQAAEQQRKQAAARWKPVLESIRRRLADRSDKVRDAAARDLLAIRDVVAIGPLMMHVAGASKQADNLLAELLGKLEGSQATQALMNVAVFSEYPTARTAAAEQLKRRDLDSFAPLLLSGMYKPIRTRDELRNTGKGIYLWRRTIECEGQFAINKAVADGLVVSYADGAVSGKSDRPRTLAARRGLSDEKLSTMPRVNDASRAAAIQSAAASGEKIHRQDVAIEEQNRRIAQQNERIAAVLNLVTEQHLEPQPDVWWKWWNDRYEMITTEKREKLAYHWRISSLAPRLTYDPSQFVLANGGTALVAIDTTYFARQAEEKQRKYMAKFWADLERDGLEYERQRAAAEAPYFNLHTRAEYDALMAEIDRRWGYGNDPAKGYREWQRQYMAQHPEVPVFWFSCFAAGTKVWTMEGPRPIEQVRLGDLVLSQDPHTGELAYKTVMQTSVRPAMPLLKLRAGEEDISCTPGHPFWVNGRGWTMAKELAEGCYLHGRLGAEPLWKMETAPAQQTYNLVVADFQSYFVGKAGLLVHDNGLWEPTDAAIPGMAAEQ